MPAPFAFRGRAGFSWQRSAAASHPHLRWYKKTRLFLARPGEKLRRRREHPTAQEAVAKVETACGAASGVSAPRHEFLRRQGVPSRLLHSNGFFGSLSPHAVPDRETAMSRGSDGPRPGAVNDSSERSV